VVVCAPTDPGQYGVSRLRHNLTPNDFARGGRMRTERHVGRPRSSVFAASSRSYLSQGWSVQGRQGSYLAKEVRQVPVVTVLLDQAMRRQGPE
jgi:hypothetical protein